MKKGVALFAFLIMAAILVVRSVGVDGIGAWFTPPPPPPPPPTTFVWLDEAFDDNRNDWTLREEVSRRNAIINGNYVFENRSDDSYHWAYTDVDSLTDTRDYTIEATIKKKSGRTNNTYGLIWGFDDEYRRYEFGITDDGSYRISRCVNNAWEYLVKYTGSSAIRIPNGENVLSIKKRGLELHFLINRQPVDTLVYQPLFGNGVGIGVHSDIALEIASIRVTSP